ncbi:MAG TPA: hypothetical protein VLI54_00570 [Bacillota bacterium]|nr:hypothetical protein [Bacillota bacterium]
MKKQKITRSTATSRSLERAKSKQVRLPKNASTLRRVHHHTKRVFGMVPMFVHGAFAGAFIGIIALMIWQATLPASALSLSSPRDCDSNAVINCGALTTTELTTRYNNKGVGTIYASFGITAADISATPTTAVAGRVYKDGTVKVGDTTVATAAITAGRENISGSTKVVSAGTTFYKRPPSVSFRVDSIAAYVVMANGQFKFAILAACGNPVTATAVPKAATPAPTPEVTKPVVEQPVETPISAPSTQTPASTPTPPATLASAQTVTSLPNAGPGAVVLIAVLAVVGGYAFHMTHRHVRHRRRLRAQH